MSNQVFAIGSKDSLSKRLNLPRASWYILLFRWKMAWLWLALAIIFEVCGTTFLKKSEGFSKLIPTLTTLGFYTVSFWLLAICLKTIEVSIAYAIWGGLGIVLVSMIGFFYFGETITFAKCFFIFLIVAGVVGLNLFKSAAH